MARVSVVLLEDVRLRAEKRPLRLDVGVCVPGGRGPYERRGCDGGGIGPIMTAL